MKGTFTSGLSQLVFKCLIKGPAEVNKPFYRGSTMNSGLMNELQFYEDGWTGIGLAEHGWLTGTDNTQDKRVGGRDPLGRFSDSCLILIHAQYKWESLFLWAIRGLLIYAGRNGRKRRKENCIHSCKRCNVKSSHVSWQSRYRLAQTSSQKLVKNPIWNWHVLDLEQNHLSLPTLFPFWRTGIFLSFSPSLHRLCRMRFSAFKMFCGESRQQELCLSFQTPLPLCHQVSLDWLTQSMLSDIFRMI